MKKDILDSLLMSIVLGCASIASFYAKMKVLAIFFGMAFLFFCAITIILAWINFTKDRFGG